MKKLFFLLFIICCLIFSHAQDGTLDTNFGQYGTKYLPELSYASDMKNDSKHNMVILGYKGSEVRMMRILENGDYDLSFATNGVLGFTFQGLPSKLFINQKNDIFITFKDVGKIVKIKANGSIDNQFGSNGILTFSTESLEKITSIAEDVNGKIYLAVSYPNSLEFKIYSFNADGQRNTSFGGGILNLSTTSTSTLLDLSFDSKDKLRVLFLRDEFSILKKYNFNGTEDVSFVYNKDKFKHTQIDISTIKGKMMDDDTVYLFGTFSGYRGIVKYLPNGSPDSTFGSFYGLAMLGYGSSIYGFAFQETNLESKIICSYYYNDKNFLLERISALGKGDTNFTSTFTGTWGGAKYVPLQISYKYGKIYALNNDSYLRPSIVRFNLNSALLTTDLEFNNDVILFYNKEKKSLIFSEFLQNVSITDASGKIVIIKKNLTKEIDFDKENKGVYILKGQMINNRLVIKKFVN